MVADLVLDISGSTDSVILRSCRLIIMTRVFLGPSFFHWNSRTGQLEIVRPVERQVDG
jgi:hypothetical protein